MKFKFTIALFFLISLVNLQKSQLNLKSFLSIPRYEEDDEEKCRLAGTDKNECQAVKLSNNNNQCCFNIVTRSEGMEKYCATFPFPAKGYADMLTEEQYKAFLKENMGFLFYTSNSEEDKELLDNLKMKITKSCKDVEFNVSFGYDEYTEADENIFKSEDYCLNYYFESFSNDFQGKHDCKNGKVLDSSKSVGLECGNIEIKAKIEGETKKMKSCYLYSYDLYSKYPSQYVKDLILEYTGSFGKFDPYTITLSDSNGENRYSFDYSNSG